MPSNEKPTPREQMKETKDHRQKRLQFFADEAMEVHEYLTSKGIPMTCFSSNGKLIDAVTGKQYYILPLIDRVMMGLDLRARSPKKKRP